jgi:hypothetical protein
MAGARVPFRRVNLSNGEHLDLYDTSGPYTDPGAVIDLAAGLPPGCRRAPAWCATGAPSCRGRAPVSSHLRWRSSPRVKVSARNWFVMRWPAVER